MINVQTSALLHVVNAFLYFPQLAVQMHKLSTAGTDAAAAQSVDFAYDTV